MMLEEGIFVLTFINGQELIGSVKHDENRDAFAVVKPYQLVVSPDGLQLRPILHGNPFLTGDRLRINSATLLWYAEPSADVLKGYKSAISGIVMPGSPSPVMPRLAS